MLKYINDLPEKEIAEILNININTLKSRLFKARIKLESILKEGEAYEQQF